MTITFQLGHVDDAGNVHHGCGIDHYNCCGACNSPDFREFGCCDCVMEARDACPDCVLAVNVSNTNARAILERLGVEFDYCGTLDPTDLLGRAMTANIGQDDSGRPSSIETGAGGATMIDCGRSAGYFDRNFERLATLATIAQRRALPVVWG